MPRRRTGRRSLIVVVAPIIPITVIIRGVSAVISDGVILHVGGVPVVGAGSGRVPPQKNPPSTMRSRQLMRRSHRCLHHSSFTFSTSS
jgi:hypothetical protein